MTDTKRSAMSAGTSSSSVTTFTAVRSIAPPEPNSDIVRSMASPTTA